MKYDESMDTKDIEKWGVYVEEEHNKMKRYSNWAPIKLKYVPDKANIFHSPMS